MYRRQIQEDLGLVEKEREKNRTELLTFCGNEIMLRAPIPLKKISEQEHGRNKEKIRLE